MEDEKRLQRQKQLQEEPETSYEESKSQEQQAKDVAAFLAGEGGVATGVVAMDTTPPSSDVTQSGVSDSLSAVALAPPQDSQTGQTGFEEPVSGQAEQWQWPQQDQEQSQKSLGLTATNPELAQVLPPAADTAPFGVDYSTTESANSSTVTPSAPPPTYDQVAAGQGIGQMPGAVGGGVQGGYDPAYQSPYGQQAQTHPPGTAYFPPSYATPPPGSTSPAAAAS